MAHDVFISYSHIDKAVADAVCHHLERDKIRCWIAPRDITPGDEFADAISDALSKTKLFLLIFSSHSNISKYVLREVELAVKNGLTIVTIKIEDLEPSRSMEFYLSVVHWIDAVNKNLEQQLKKLSVTVANILAAGETPVLKKETDKRQESKPTAKTQVRKKPSKSKLNKKWLIPAALLIVAAAATVTFIILNPFNKDINNTNGTIENLDVPVEITDENIDNAIRSTLINMGESIGDEITANDMLKLTYLIVGDDAEIAKLNDRATNTELLDRFTSLMIQTENDISSLEGLQYAKNLEELLILGKSIRDLTPISSLENLTFIDLCGNEIYDWSPLSGMTNLQKLVLEDNLLIDISSLSNMDSLTALNLSSNQVEDISALQSLEHLEYIVLKNNKITDISALRDMRYLEGINLASNDLKDISPLQYLRKAKWLDLDDNHISDISPLADLTELEHVILSNNKITDLSPLNSLQNLQTVDIHNNNIQKLDTLPEVSLHQLKIDKFIYRCNDNVMNLFAEAGIEIIIVHNGEEFQIDQISMGYVPSDFGWDGNTIINFADDALYATVSIELERVINESNAHIDTSDGITINEMLELHFLILVKGGYETHFNLYDFIQNRHLEYTSGDIHSLEPLKYAKNLEILVLCGFEGFEESGLLPIQDLDSLLVICLPGNNIDNLDFLQNKPRLYYLELSDNNITDISVLTEPALKKLFIAENEFVDFSPLDGTTTLEELHIDYDGINDIYRMGIRH